VSKRAVGKAGSGPRHISAVDLGSNSFHMVVATLADGQIQIVDRMKERVALAEGLGPDGRLDAEAKRRAIACLERFGQRLRGFDELAVRAVGTNTLRKAKNRRAFLRMAERALGHRIGIIPGHEEARLVYLGVAHSLADDTGRRLVVDVGGGSTEIALGRRFTTEQLDSLYMGCVSFTRRYFPDGRVRSSAMNEAVLQARLEVEPVAGAYISEGWDHAIGSSGTALAIASILTAGGDEPGVITRKSLRRLAQMLVDLEDVEGLSELAGLKEERRPVIAGGVAVMLGVFEELGIKRMGTSGGALREGLLYELLGRIGHEDVRENTVRRLMARHAVDEPHAHAVRDTALELFDSVQDGWELDEGARVFVDWASRLHEIGLPVSFSGHHRHAAYLIEHGNMPGFTSGEQHLLAAIVRAHRGKIDARTFEALRPPDDEQGPALAALVRIAVRLHRSRREDAVPEMRVEARPGRLELAAEAAWLAAHPLTLADIKSEVRALARLGIKLVLDEY
jgi:exopolyphosphatase/guanosine-5'-triphosphate,3'-diphosphate pyrophosphatase